MEGKTKKRLQNAMYGVGVATTLPKGWSPRLLRSRRTRPPSYILELLFKELFEGALRGGVEKLLGKS